MDHTAPIEHLYRARRRGKRPDAPLFDYKFDVEEALSVQLGVLKRLVADGEGVGGWKIGLTSGGARNVLGAGVRPFGYILDSRIFQSPATLDAGRIVDCQVEAELCLVLGSDLGGPVIDAAQARAAVSHVAAAFEVNEKRVALAERSDLFVADGLSNWGMVLGASAPVPASLDDLKVKFVRDGRVLQDGSAEGGIDDHFESLATLARVLHARGISLKRGNRVITGSIAKQLVTEPGTYEATFDNIGTVEATFTFSNRA